MARKPSDRTNRHRDPGELELTPLMDIITNLMFFLLIFANLIPVVTIDAPLPKVAQTADEQRKALKDDANLDVTVRINSAGFTVESGFASTRSIPLDNAGKYRYKDLHLYLIELKKQKQKAKEVTIIPQDATLYDTIIQVMDSARELYRDDPGYQTVPAEEQNTPAARKYNQLFPDAIIGGV